MTFMQNTKNIYDMLGVEIDSDGHVTSFPDPKTFEFQDLGWNAVFGIDTNFENGIMHILNKKKRSSKFDEYPLTEFHQIRPEFPNCFPHYAFNRMFDYNTDLSLMMQRQLLMIETMIAEMRSKIISDFKIDPTPNILALMFPSLKTDKPKRGLNRNMSCDKVMRVVLSLTGHLLSYGNIKDCGYIECGKLTPEEVATITTICQPLTWLSSNTKNIHYMYYNAHNLFEMMMYTQIQSAFSGFCGSRELSINFVGANDNEQFGMLFSLNESSIVAKTGQHYEHPSSKKMIETLDTVQEFYDFLIVRKNELFALFLINVFLKGFFNTKMKKLSGDFKMSLYSNASALSKMAKESKFYNQMPKDLKTKHKSLLKVGRGFRSLLPDSVSDGFVETLTSMWMKSFSGPDAKTTHHHIGSTPEDFEYGFSWLFTKNDNSAPTNFCKLQTNSCMRYMVNLYEKAKQACNESNEKHIPYSANFDMAFYDEVSDNGRHPSFVYASGDFYISYLSNSETPLSTNYDDRLMSRVVVGVARDVKVSELTDVEKKAFDKKTTAENVIAHVLAPFYTTSDALFNYHLKMVEQNIESINKNDNENYHVLRVGFRTETQNDKDFNVVQYNKSWDGLRLRVGPLIERKGDNYPLNSAIAPYLDVSSTFAYPIAEVDEDGYRYFKLCNPKNYNGDSVFDANKVEDFVPLNVVDPTQFAEESEFKKYSKAYAPDGMVLPIGDRRRSLLKPHLFDSVLLISKGAFDVRGGHKGIQSYHTKAYPIGSCMMCGKKTTDTNVSFGKAKVRNVKKKDNGINFATKNRLICTGCENKFNAYYKPINSDNPIKGLMETGTMKTTDPVYGSRKSHTDDGTDVFLPRKGETRVYFEYNTLFNLNEVYYLPYSISQTYSLEAVKRQLDTYLSSKNARPIVDFFNNPVDLDDPNLFKRCPTTYNWGLRVNMCRKNNSWFSHQTVIERWEYKFVSLTKSYNMEELKKVVGPDEVWKLFVTDYYSRQKVYRLSKGFSKDDTTSELFRTINDDDLPALKKSVMIRSIETVTPFAYELIKRNPQILKGSFEFALKIQSTDDSYRNAIAFCS